MEKGKGEASQPLTGISGKRRDIVECSSPQLRWQLLRRRLMAGTHPAPWDIRACIPDVDIVNGLRQNTHG
jgi:hypothetical protein